MPSLTPTSISYPFKHPSRLLPTPAIHYKLNKFFGNSGGGGGRNEWCLGLGRDLWRDSCTSPFPPTSPNKKIDASIPSLNSEATPSANGWELKGGPTDGRQGVAEGRNLWMVDFIKLFLGVCLGQKHLFYFFYWSVLEGLIIIINT